MAQMGSLVVSLELQQEQFQKGMDQAARQLARAEAQSRKTESAFTGLQNGMKAVGQAAAAFATAMAAFKGVEAITKAADQLNNLKGSFSALTGDANRASDMMQRIFGVVERTGAPLEAVGGAFQRLTIAMQALGASNRQIETVAETFIQLGKVGGSSAAETAAALQQLGQALASGKLGGDELKSIRENAPLVAEAIASAIGVTSGQLKQLGEDGKLTSDVVGNALIKAASNAKAAFAQMPVTFEQALNKMDAQSTQFLAAFDKASGLTKNLVTVTDAVTASLARWTAELEGANGKLTPIGIAASALDQSFRVVAGIVAAINFQLELSIRSVATLILLAGDVGTGFSNVSKIMADFGKQTGKALADLIEFEKRLAGIAKTANAAQARGAARGDELRPVEQLKPPPGVAGSGTGKSDADKEAEALKKRGEALAAQVDSLNAFNQKMVEYNELLNKGAISDVIFAKAVEAAKKELTAAGDALKASVDPYFAHQQQMEKINEAYRNGSIEIEHWLALVKEADDKLKENTKGPKTFKDEVEDLEKAMAKSIGAGIGDFFGDLAKGSMSAAQAFSKMVETVTKKLAELVAEFAAVQITKGLLSLLGGGAGGLTANPDLGKSSLMLASRPPTFNAAASLAGPSTRAGEPAPVTGSAGAAGAGGSPWNVVINNNAPGVGVTTNTRSDGGLDVTVEKVRSMLAQDVLRGGNQFSRSLESAYSLGRGR